MENIVRRMGEYDVDTQNQILNSFVKQLGLTWAEDEDDKYEGRSMMNRPTNVPKEVLSYSADAGFTIVK
jgi:hypothetical protein